MPIKLLDFKKTKCVAVLACGNLVDGDKSLSELLKSDHVDRIASYKIGRSEFYLALSLGSSQKQKNHLHVDVMKKGLFSLICPPENVVDMKEITRLVERFIGCKIQVRVTGMFEVDIADLPEEGFIRSNLFESQEDNFSIKMDAAEYRFEGAPVSRMFWRRSSKKEKMLIENGIKLRINRRLQTS